MREIKFRAKVYHNPQKVYLGSGCQDGEWVYGDLHLQCANPHIHIKEHHREPIDVDTIGQFTGLHDKNGKEVYEGDIVALPSQDIAFGIITWHDNGYFFIDTSDGVWRSFGNDFRTLGEFMNLGDDHKIKVIGNIHDNLDLLK